MRSFFYGIGMFSFLALILTFTMDCKAFEEINENVFSSPNIKKLYQKKEKKHLSLSYCRTLFESAESPTKRAKNDDEATLSEVETYLQNLLKDKKPETILYISDIDGTWTDDSNPTKTSVIGPRENAKELVTEMLGKGVKVVGTSACSDFKAILNRLTQIGLDKVLKLKSDTVQEELFKFENEEGTCCYAGLVAAVRLGFCEFEDDFPDKAFSAPIVYPNLDFKTITDVVFSDDSKESVKIFNKQIWKLGLPENVTIKSFTLSKVGKK